MRGPLGKCSGQEGKGERIFFAWLSRQVGLEGQELDLRKFPRTSAKRSEGRREVASGAGMERGAGAGGLARGAGAVEPAGGRVASQPSLLAGLRAAAQMLL